MDKKKTKKTRRITVTVSPSLYRWIVRSAGRESEAGVWVREMLSLEMEVEVMRAQTKRSA